MPATVEQPQHMQALARANVKRLKRAAVRRELKAGSASATEVIKDPPPELDTMTIADLLRAQDRWGMVRVRKFLTYLTISEHRTLNQLTPRQRELLATELVRKAGA